MKLQLLAALIPLLAYASALPSSLYPRQDGDDEGILRDEGYLETALGTPMEATNDTLPDLGPVAQFIPPGRVRGTSPPPGILGKRC